MIEIIGGTTTLLNRGRDHVVF